MRELSTIDAAASAIPGSLKTTTTECVGCGVRDFLANGLTIAEASRDATAQYREEMDPIGRFVADCVEPNVGGRVQARALYEAYKSWALANAVSVCFETRFGREMKKRFPKDTGPSCKAYLGIALHDVPTRPEEFER